MFPNLQVLCICTFKNGYFREMFIWHHAPMAEYWPLWTRQIGSLLQLLPIFCIPLSALVQSYRYLNNGPNDILDVSFTKYFIIMIIHLKHCLKIFEIFCSLCYLFYFWKINSAVIIFIALFFNEKFNINNFTVIDPFSLFKWN